jgi:hypothetical protein
VVSVKFRVVVAPVVQFTPLALALACFFVAFTVYSGGT